MIGFTLPEIRRLLATVDHIWAKRRGHPLT